MPTPKRTAAERARAVRAFAEHGTVLGAAAALDMPRSTLQNILKDAAAHGEFKPVTVKNPPRHRIGDEIIQARKAEFERVHGARPDRQTLIHLADDGPFLLACLGDPHLDNPGTDLRLWERWCAILDYRQHRHGIALGDWLDNWVRPLAFLYAQAEITAPEGWVMLEHYLDQIGEHLIASVAGNHDDWSGQSDVLGGLMRKHGVAHRSKSLRVVLRTPGQFETSVHMRHRWSGRSMWNEVHAMKKAARMGVRDNILLGGDKHISGDTIEKDPMSGMLTFCYQVGAFKLIDDYADDLGLLDRQTSPAVALVVQPQLPITSPERVKHFYEPEPAADYLKFLRRKK